MLTRRLVPPLLFGLTFLSLGQTKNSSESADMERKKLELEIRDLSKPWFLRPEYLSAILPTLIGAGTVWVLFNRGYFDAQKERHQAEAIRLENQRTQLKKDIEQFENQKGELVRQISDKEAALDSLGKKSAEAELGFHLERLVRVMVPNNARGIQLATNRVLGTAPNEVELIQPSLEAARGLITRDDDLAPTRLAIVRSYLEKETTPREMKEALRAILEGKT